jgi:hypothetical protein
VIISNIEGAGGGPDYTPFALKKTLRWADFPNNSHLYQREMIEMYLHLNNQIA